MPIDEKKTAAASYILTFYQEVTQITQIYAQYENFIIQLENKYNTEEMLKKATDEEKNAISASAQTARASAMRVYIQYKSIQTHFKQQDSKTSKEIESAYKNVKSNYIINRQDLEKFVTNLNIYLVSEIMQTLLDSSQNILTQIYNASPNTA